MKFITIAFLFQFLITLFKKKVFKGNKMIRKQIFSPIQIRKLSSHKHFEPGILNLMS